MRTLFIVTMLCMLLPSLATAQATDYRYGTPMQHANLTLVPVYPPKGTPTFSQQYMTFAEAAREKLIKVTELNGNTSNAQVSAVHVTNRSDKPIFLMAGEVILGGKQDRVISNNTIVAPRKKKLEVAVFCVEQGRWDGRRAEFQASGKVGHSKLRSKAMFANSQDEVWAEVADQNKKSKVAPSTGTYRATLDQKELTAASSRYVAVLLPLIAADSRAIGVVVAIDGHVKSMDVFANPSLFAKMRTQLVHAYAQTAASSDDPRQTKFDPSELGRLNQRLADAEKAPKKARPSGQAHNDYFDTPDTKTAVTRSQEGEAVHRFMSVE